MAFMPTPLLIRLRWNTGAAIKVQSKAYLSILSPAVAITSAWGRVGAGYAYMMLLLDITFLLETGFDSSAPSSLMQFV